jgi:hypothetical protein
LNHQNYNAIRILKPKEKQYETALKKFIQTNIEFKNQLLGAVIGQFTHAELTFYMNHRKEINKRIMQMQLNRYFDSL